MLEVRLPSVHPGACTAAAFPEMPNAFWSPKLPQLGVQAGGGAAGRAAAGKTRKELIQV